MNQDQGLILEVSGHKRAIADIVCSAIRDIDGVRLIENDFKRQPPELLGYKIIQNYR